MTEEIAREKTNLSFWLEIFKEHTIFIQQALPCNRKNLINQARDFQVTLEQLQSKAESINRNPFRTEDDQLLEASIQTTKELLEFKQDLLARKIQCQLDIKLYPLLLNHLVREVKEFLSLTNICYDTYPTFAQSILDEETFWLKIMADHLRFICHFLDPSEVTFISKTQGLTRRFTELHRQAQDLQSMLQSKPKQFPKVAQFTDVVITKTKNLYQFKEEAYQLLTNCQLLAIAPPLLAEHVAEEAAHFLTVIKQIQRYFKQQGQR